jgi:ABC-2 type transport system ATP-binding protein
LSRHPEEPMGKLELNQVTKRYRSLTAVDDVSFSASPGRILGLLGPNGAGKTSTIRMLTYITMPDEGEILFAGRRVGSWTQEAMGYLPEERGLYKKLTVGEQLLYLAELKGLSRTEARRRIARWLERFDATDWHGKKTEELSKGMQQKIQFIATVLHDPRLLILDEPFSGLDPINAEILREVIYEMKDDGRTILFASHRMEQVEQLCDDICLISRGRIVLQGALREVKRSFGRNTVILEFDGDGSFVGLIEQRGLGRVGMRTHHRIELHEVSDPRGVLDLALAHIDELYRFELVEPSLNEIFVRVVGSDNGRPEVPHLAPRT